MQRRVTPVRVPGIRSRGGDAGQESECPHLYPNAMAVGYPDGKQGVIHRRLYLFVCVKREGDTCSS